MVSQVLSNDQLRAAYDRDGADSSSLESASFVDPALFFNMLFGSDKFEPYVGRLKLAAFASVAAGSPHPLTKSDLRKITTPSKVDGFGTYVHTWIALNRVGVCLTCPCAGCTGEADAGEEMDLAGQWGGEKALRVQNAREVRHRHTMDSYPT